MTTEEILKSVTIDNNIVKLPDITLERSVYLDVSKKLELIGGKWNKKNKGFIFNQDPTELISQIANGGNRNLKKEYQFFGTPDEIVERLLHFSDLKEHHSVLEPSAGQGAIIKGIRRIYPNIHIDCCELLDINRLFLSKIDNITIIEEDFFNIINRSYDRIIANPPFSKNQDIDHIYKMYECLAPGGILVSIASAHWEHSKNKKETTFRKWLNDVNAFIDTVEAGAFKESGTTIESRIIVIERSK